MRAASENHCALFYPETGENGSRSLWINFNVLGIVLDAADVANFPFFNPDCFPSLNILEILDANRIEEPKCRRDNRALTKAIGISLVCASATKLGQTSASTKMTALGLIVANARRMPGQKSRGLYITSIQSGAL